MLSVILRIDLRLEVSVFFSMGGDYIVLVGYELSLVNTCRVNERSSLRSGKEVFCFLEGINYL